MKLPVLVVAAATHARAVRTAIGDDYSLTVTDDPDQGRALAATGGYLAVLTVGAVDETFRGAMELEADAGAASIQAAVHQAVRRLEEAHRAQARTDVVGTVPYDDYIELARYAATRRYLMALLSHHGGSVTDAARGAKMKRESLHRLLRRHHLIAEDFRERS
ncbi:MAG: hypothetical protein WKG01_10790 [Kofleriaceae bacterium]